jgi:hypothetical protein
MRQLTNKQWRGAAVAVAVSGFLAAARSSNSSSTGSQSAGSPAGSSSAGSSSRLAVVPLLAAFLLLQRFWQSGLTAGSVKE